MFTMSGLCSFGYEPTYLNVPSVTNCLLNTNYHDVAFRKWGFPNLGVPRRLATVQCMGATLTTIKASTEI